MGFRPLDAAGKDVLRRVSISAGVLIAMIAVFTIVFVTLVQAYRINFVSVSGNSMVPTFHNGSLVVLAGDKNVERDQIAVFSRPPAWSNYIKSEGAVLIKRVGAVPGDTLAYDGRLFTVNGKVLFTNDKSDYRCLSGDTRYRHTLTAGEMFAIGDNRDYSLDSRHIFCDGKTKEFLVPTESIQNHGHVLVSF